MVTGVSVFFITSLFSVVVVVVVFIHLHCLNFSALTCMGVRKD